MIVGNFLFVINSKDSSHSIQMFVAPGGCGKIVPVSIPQKPATYTQTLVILLPNGHQGYNFVPEIERI